jgi:16S rRNA G1207 methylase RsmC
MANTYERYKQDLVFTTELCGHALRFHSTWGLFSPERVDDGSRLLLDHVQVGEQDVSLDLGCGYGAIGVTLAKQSPGGTVHMVDKDFVAVEYAKKNAQLNDLENCEVYLSNGFSYVPFPVPKFDNIVSNLPAKVSNELFFILFNDAKKYLKPGGKLYVVTITGLREYIKRSFKDIFGNYDKLQQTQKYTVALAVKE